MCMRCDFLLFVAMAPAAVTPALAQTPSAAGRAGSEAHHAAPVPDFSDVWNHPAFPWFEPPASGPGPITNLSGWPEQRPQGEDGSAASQASKVGISNYDRLVEDYKTFDLAALGGSSGKDIRSQFFDTINDHDVIIETTFLSSGIG
jgi:hypothetical protein